MSDTETLERAVLDNLEGAMSEITRRSAAPPALITAPPDPVSTEEAQEAAVNAGMKEWHALRADRDRYRRLLEDMTRERDSLINAADSAAETERLRIKAVADEAVTVGKKFEVEAEVLRGEISDLRARLAAADVRTMEALSRVSAYDTLVGVIERAASEFRERQARAPVPEALENGNGKKGSGR